MQQIHDNQACKSTVIGTVYGSTVRYGSIVKSAVLGRFCTVQQCKNGTVTVRSEFWKKHGENRTFREKLQKMG